MLGIKEILFPEGSRRRFIAVLAKRILTNPRQMFAKLSVENIRKLIHGMNNRTPSAMVDLLNMHVPKRDPASRELVIVKTSNNKDEFEPIVFPANESPVVSIVIPVYNNFDYTHNCLRAIKDNSGDVPYEIIIADDCSTDITKDCEHIFPGVRVFHNEKNLLFLRNCNNAAKVAKGTYILFLNNDTQVRPNWLQPLVELIERDEKVGMVGSKLVYPDGRLQEAGGIVWNDASAWNFGHLDDPQKPEYNYVKEVDYISGAAIMIRRNLWEQLGGFDETFAPAYCEDSDLAFSVRAAGYKVVYQPLSVVVHFEGISNGTDVQSGIKHYQEVNKEKFYEKWKAVLEKEHFKNGENVFLARDRSRGKKTILVVDHYVPHYDQDAGGRTTYLYLKLFVRMGLRVVFVGDNYYPHEPYMKELNQLGIEVLAGHWWSLEKVKEWTVSNSKNIDYAYLQRPHIAVKYIDFIRQLTNAKIIYYGHDLHFLRTMRRYELEKDEYLLKEAQDWKKKEFALYNKADVVHVVGSFEQELLANALRGKAVRNIPAFVYEENEVVDVEQGTVADRDIMIFVGGFGHDPNVDAIIWFMNSIYPFIHEKYPGMNFYIIGSKPTQQIKDYASDDVIVTGYVTDEELASYYARAIVNVVPLRYGAGIKGKVLEGMKFGVPTVTTSVGAEGFLGAEQALTICDEAALFISGICRCIDDKDYWQSCSKQSTKYVRNNFTRDAAERVIKKDIRP